MKNEMASYYLPAELIKKIKQEAKIDRRSASVWVTLALESAVKLSRMERLNKPKTEGASNA